MGLQGGGGCGGGGGGCGGGGLAAGPSCSPVVDTAPSHTVVTKQRTQTRGKVGRHRVVARFDVRPQQQPASDSWLDTTCTSCPPSISTRELDDRDVDTGEDNITDVHEVATLLTDGDES